MSAYDALERLAAGLVAKSGGSLSPDQAMVRVLKTERGRELYERYLVKQAQQIRAAGLDPHNGYAPAAQAVRKAAAADDALEQLARRYQEAHADEELTFEQAYERVSKTPEGRDLLAARENWRDGEGVASAGSRAGTADASGGRQGSGSATGGLQGRGAGGPRYGQGATSEVRKGWTSDQVTFLEQLAAPFGDDARDRVAKAADPVEQLLDELGI